MAASTNPSGSHSQLVRTRPKNFNTQARGPSTLMTFLPLEVRRLIYVELLTTSDVIQVRDRWSQIHPRERPGLDTAILRTCRQAWKEGIQTLYGENTFQYVVREAAVLAPHQIALPPSGPPISIPGLSLSATTGDDLTDEDYVEHVSASLLRRSKGSHAPTEGYIDQPRFGPLFRRLRIVAEANRSQPQYRQTIVQAIEAFANLSPYRANLHSIALEVTPSRDSETGAVSFVDFFARDSPLLVALKRLPTQLIEVSVRTHARLETLRQDMRHATFVRRAKRGEVDMWAGDELVLQARKEKAQKTRTELNALAEKVRKVFEEDEEAQDEGFDYEDEDYDDDERGLEAAEWQVDY